MEGKDSWREEKGSHREVLACSAGTGRRSRGGDRPRCPLVYGPADRHATCRSCGSVQMPTGRTFGINWTERRAGFRDARRLATATSAPFRWGNCLRNKRSYLDKRRAISSPPSCGAKKKVNVALF